MVGLLKEEVHDHIALLLLSLACSFGGIFLSVFGFISPLDGERGGALAVAISFAGLFANRSYGKELYLFLTEKRQAIQDGINVLEDQPIEDHVVTLKGLEEKIQAVRSQIDLDTEGQKRQNFYLTCSAVVGTIAWGFGDLVVFSMKYLLNHI